jgi:NAD(P)H-nitrite reductase large subunit
MKMRLERKLIQGDFIPRADDELIVCRCEEITRGEIRRAVYDGMYTMGEVKRYLRAGMGLCQGQTCSSLVQNIIARELGLAPGEVGISTSRSPARPIQMREMAMDGVNE